MRIENYEFKITDVINVINVIFVTIAFEILKLRNWNGHFRKISNVMWVYIICNRELCYFSRTIWSIRRQLLESSTSLTDGTQCCQTLNWPMLCDCIFWFRTYLQIWLTSKLCSRLVTHTTGVVVCVILKILYSPRREFGTYIVLFVYFTVCNCLFSHNHLANSSAPA